MEEMKRLPDNELAVMLVVWESTEAAPTGDILEALNRERKRSLQTVQNTLGRLVEKGFLRCEKIGRLNYYSPLIDAEAYRAAETSTILERLYDNSPSKLFLTLLEQETITDGEREQLRQLLEKGGRQE